MSLADHGVRKYDDGLGRFTCPDKLWEKFYQWTPYQYSYNNPVNYHDGNGLLPGDKFYDKPGKPGSGALIAAHDFSKNYNSISISQGREFGTIIYAAKDKNGKIYNSYVIPERGTEAGLSADENTSLYKKIPAGSIPELKAHTHGEELKEYNDNEFSNTDLNGYKKESIDGFVATPNGSGIHFDFLTGEIKIIFSDLPSDKDDPTRKNKVGTEKQDSRPTPYTDDGKKYEIK